MPTLRPLASNQISLIAVFAAMVAVLDAIPMLPGFSSGVWDSWLFLISPLVGIILGPAAGAMSVGLGTLVGHMIYFRDPYELLFMLGAPVGAAVSGLVYDGRWREAVVINTLLFAAYFLTPVTWSLPLWGIWDTLSTYIVLIVIASYVTFRHGSRPQWMSRKVLVGLSAVFGLEADILTRIFFLIPCQTYWLFYGFTPEQLAVLWLVAGIITPLKVVFAGFITVLIGCPLLRALPVQFDRYSLETDY
ncbi:MAG: hypothetical protein K9W43_13745 [Candidatus Thorarchaeota archaeon]|nr:hypothetical protein [Candidatus Thorarchaeota archaeon]